MEAKFYSIGDKEFYQDKASAWQMCHLAKLLHGRDLHSLSATAILELLGPDDILTFYGLLLVPKGMSKEAFIAKHLTPGAMDFRVLFATYIDEVLTLEILADFLAFILAPSNMSRISEALGHLLALLPTLVQEETTPNGGSNGLLPSLPEATLANASASTP